MQVRLLPLLQSEGRVWLWCVAAPTSQFNTLELIELLPISVRYSCSLKTGIYMHNVMIDLETMGLKPSAPIVAIGAAFFDPATGNVGATYSATVLLNSEMVLGAVPDADAIMWWMLQSAEARVAICHIEAKSILVALHELNAFVKANRVGKSVKVWGNGASFDNVILRAAYHRANIQPFWNFYDDLDVRTIVEIGRLSGIDPKREIPFTGERHNALADVLHQVQYVSAIFQQIDAIQLCHLSDGAAK